MLSNDTIIVKPPYTITPQIMELVAIVSEKIGIVNATFLDKPSPQLRKQNRIKTIQSTLQIEGNTLTEEQITALIENKPVLGPKKDIVEVFNAIAVYEQLQNFNPIKEQSFLKAHKLLMTGLNKDAGAYRKKGVGIMKGNQVQHVAPPYENIPYLMKDLFEYVKSTDEIPLIKSCVFHYELEFIHPFIDGNGRMGRLWQTLLLMERYPIFSFLPFETLISNNQEAYYHALAKSDKAGNSTFFIVYMLQVIDRAIDGLLDYKGRVLNQSQRLQYFLSLGTKAFSRKDYMGIFKDISTATASRDLKKALELRLICKTGENNKTVYEVIE